MNISIPISAASAILCLILSLQAYHSFRYVRKDYLLNFYAGFLLLGLCFVILVPLALGFKLPANYGDADDIASYPVFAVMQTIGYVLIALAYSQTKRARNFLIVLVGLLVVMVGLVLLPGSFVASFADIIMYLGNVMLLGFVLYHMLKVMPPTHLVFAGFLLLSIHEYTTLLATINETIYNYPDDSSFMIADIIRLSALCILIVSFLATRSNIQSIQLTRSRQFA